VERGSDKHGPRLDEGLKDDTRSIVQGAGGESRADESREQEGPGDGEPTPDARLASVARTARQPGGVRQSDGQFPTDEELEARTDLARHLDPSVFPAGRDALLALAERLAPALGGTEQASAQSALAADEDNLRAALRWLIGQGASAAAVRLAGALGQFWLLRRYFREGREWLRQALALRPAAPDAVRARALHAWARDLGAPGAALSHRHVAALDALVTGWHGQGPTALPGGIVVARRAGDLVRVDLGV
jgi:hypothetical protein